jgi:hypothetical protein
MIVSYCFIPLKAATTTIKRRELTSSVVGTTEKEIKNNTNSL